MNTFIYYLFDYNNNLLDSGYSLSFLTFKLLCSYSFTSLKINNSMQESRFLIPSSGGRDNENIQVDGWIVQEITIDEQPYFIKCFILPGSDPDVETLP